MFEKDDVRLRPLLKSDLANLNKWKNDEDVFKFLGGGFRPISIDTQEKWLEKMIVIDDSNQRYMIEYQGRPVGMVGLYAIHPINRTCEIGIYLGERDYQGKGIGKIAYCLLEYYAINYLGIRKAKIFVVEDNEPAVSFWTNLGFDLIGTMKQERFINGAFRNVLIMEKFYA